MATLRPILPRRVTSPIARPTRVTSGGVARLQGNGAGPAQPIRPPAPTPFSGGGLRLLPPVRQGGGLPAPHPAPPPVRPVVAGGSRPPAPTLRTLTAQATRVNPAGKLVPGRAVGLTVRVIRKPRPGDTADYGLRFGGRVSGRATPPKALPRRRAV